jgi:hypothetical protein
MMTMDFAPPTVTIGHDILDIGSRKARRQRGDPLEMIPDTGSMMGLPGQFDLPAVSNVSCRGPVGKFTIQSSIKISLVVAWIRLTQTNPSLYFCDTAGHVLSH